MPSLVSRPVLAAFAVCMVPAYQTAAEGPSLCARVAPQMQRALGKKLKAGIPFELLSIVEQGDKAVCHQSLQIHYSLWDKRVRVTDGEEILGRFDEGVYTEIACARLLCTKGVAVAKKARFRIFVNPNWSGRLARLQARTGAVSQLFFSFNWNDLTKNLGKDETLHDEEFIP